MRTLRIDFTSENILPDGDVLGRMGEHNATDIIITPTEEMAQCEKIVNYVAAFVTDGKIIRSDIYPKGETVTVSLCAQLTQDHTLGIQLEGYDGRGALVVKSPIVTDLKLLPSAGGDEAALDSEDGGIVSQINLNTLARHGHENGEILDGFGEGEGILTYKGLRVGSRKTKEIILDYIKGDINFDCCNNYMHIYQFDYAFENPPVKPGMEIVSTEIYTEINGESIWVDLRDMIQYDIENLYVLYNRKTFFNSDMGCTYIAAIGFLNMQNVFAEMASYGMISKVRLTVYDDGAA